MVLGSNPDTKLEALAQPFQIDFQHDRVGIALDRAALPLVDFKLLRRHLRFANAVKEGEADVIKRRGDDRLTKSSAAHLNAQTFAFALCHSNPVVGIHFEPSTAHSSRFVKEFDEHVADVSRDVSLARALLIIGQRRRRVHLSLSFTLAILDGIIIIIIFVVCIQFDRQDSRRRRDRRRGLVIKNW